nr:glycosyltransferase family A protein [Mucilaginibacter sp. L294]
MDKTPLISVIIPNYNYSDYIITALESVAAQTYGNWECIIVDDGSTDNSREVINDFITRSRDNRFMLLQIANSGTSAAKNVGLKKAKGVLIQFLDADDLIESHKLESQLEIILKNRANLVFAESKFFTEENGSRSYFVKFPKGYLADETLVDFALLERIITNNLVTISSPLFIKAGAPKEGFVENLNNNEDWLFWVKIAFQRPLFLIDRSDLSQTLIRGHQKSAMQNSEKMYRGEIVVRAEIERLINHSGWLSTEQRKHLRFLNKRLLSLHHIRSVDVGKGLLLLAKCMIEKPSNMIELSWAGGLRLLKRIIKFRHAKK